VILSEEDPQRLRWGAEPTRRETEDGYSGRAPRELRRVRHRESVPSTPSGRRVDVRRDRVAPLQDDLHLEGVLRGERKSITTVSAEKTGGRTRCSATSHRGVHRFTRRWRRRLDAARSVSFSAGRKDQGRARVGNLRQGCRRCCSRFQPPAHSAPPPATSSPLFPARHRSLRWARKRVATRPRRIDCSTRTQSRSRYVV
jgi:hypothetical protein